VRGCWGGGGLVECTDIYHSVELGLVEPLEVAAVADGRLLTSAFCIDVSRVQTGCMASQLAGKGQVVKPGLTY
jgi:hypothetical protein